MPLIVRICTHALKCVPCKRVPVFLLQMHFPKFYFQHLNGVSSTEKSTCKQPIYLSTQLKIQWLDIRKAFQPQLSIIILSFNFITQRLDSRVLSVSVCSAFVHTRKAYKVTVYLLLASWNTVLYLCQTILVYDNNVKCSMNINQVPSVLTINIIIMCIRYYIGLKICRLVLFLFTAQSMLDSKTVCFQIIFLKEPYPFFSIEHLYLRKWFDLKI